MPLGSSKFTFRPKLFGSGTTDFAGYPTWPTLPNANVFYDFVNRFEPDAGGTSISMVNVTAIPSEINGNVVSTSADDNCTFTTLPDGNCYITIGLSTGSGSDNSSIPAHYIYDVNTGNINSLAAGGGSTFGTFASASSILEPQKNKVLLFAGELSSASRPTMVDITNNGTVINTSDGPYINRDTSGNLISLKYDRVVYSQATSNCIFVRTSGSTSSDLAVMCNIADDQNNPAGVDVANMVFTSMKLSTGSSTQMGGMGSTQSVAIAEHPRTGNIYYAGANSGFFTFQEYDPTSNVTSDFTPSGASTLFANTNANEVYFTSACLGVDEHIYFLPGSVDGIMVYDPVANVANAIIGTNEGNVYMDAKLGLDGNIYALQFRANATPSDCIMIDTRPDSATYQNISYITTGELSNNATAYSAIGLAGDGTILGYGDKFINGSTNNSGNIQNVAKITTNGTGFDQVALNPYLNGRQG